MASNGRIAIPNAPCWSSELSDQIETYRRRGPYVGIFGSAGSVQGPSVGLCEQLAYSLISSYSLLTGMGDGYGFHAALGAKRNLRRAGTFTLGVLPFAETPSWEQPSAREHDELLLAGTAPMIAPDAPREAWVEAYNSRNAINISLARTTIFFPGREGTLDELAACMRAGRPIFLYSGDTHFLKRARALPEYQSAGGIYAFAESNAADILEVMPWLMADSVVSKNSAISKKL